MTLSKYIRMRISDMVKQGLIKPDMKKTVKKMVKKTKSPLSNAAKMALFRGKLGK